jgi:hypothetical protein
MENRLSLIRIFMIHKEYWKLILFLSILFPLAYTSYKINQKPYFIGNTVIQIGRLNNSLIVDPEQLVELLKMKSVQDEILSSIDPVPAEIVLINYFKALNEAKVLRPARNILISFQHDNADFAQNGSIVLANAISKKLLSRDDFFLTLDTENEVSIKNKLLNLKAERARLQDLANKMNLNGMIDGSLFSQNILFISIISSKDSEINFLESELSKMKRNVALHIAGKSNVYFKSLDGVNFANRIIGYKIALVTLLGYIIGLGLSFIRVIGFNLSRP